MFRWIIGSSLKFRFLLLAASVALLVFGIEQLQKMPVDVFPEFAPPKVEIQTMGPGMTAAEVEELISIPMEDVLRRTPGFDIIRSKSLRGLSDIVLIFKRGEDIIEAHGGALWANSDSKAGVVLHFTIPIIAEIRSSVG